MSVKRSAILLSIVLALVLAACGGGSTDASPTPDTATPEPVQTAESTPTEEPTQEPTEAAETDDGGSTGGPTGALTDLLPDRVGNLDRMEMPPGMEQMFAGVLSQQGVNVEDAEFVWAQWGDAAELIVAGLRAPGMTQANLEMLARALAMGQTGGEVELDSETTTVGGKSVLRVTPTEGGVEQTVYIYIADDAMFTIVSQGEDLAAELLSQLP